MSEKEVVVAVLESSLAEALQALVDMVAQHCLRGDGEIDSLAIGANATALEVLARHKLVRIEKTLGRRVIARWSGS